MFSSSLQTLNFQRCPPFGVKLNTTAAGLRCCRGRLPVRIVVSGVVFTLNRIENNPQPNCSSSPWGVTQGSSYRCEKCYSKPHPRLVEKRVGGGGDALGGARRAASEAHENCDCDDADDDRGLCGSAYVGLKKWSRAGNGARGGLQKTWPGIKAETIGRLTISYLFACFTVTFHSD